MEKGIEIVARYHCQRDILLKLQQKNLFWQEEITGYVKKTVHEKYLCSAENSKMKIRKYIRLSIRSKTMLKNTNNCNIRKFRIFEGSLSEHRRYHKKYLL